MDRYDPNQWTKEFVVENKDFCIRLLKDTAGQVRDYLRQGEHTAVIAGLDRILNGLVTMINAGFDYRSHACFFSWIEANVLLFGNLGSAPEANRITAAEKCLQDAMDFAKSPTAQNTIGAILDDIHKGDGLSVLARKYAEDFPNFEVETLTNLTNRLDGSASPVAAKTPVKKKKKSGFFIIVLLLLGALGVLALLNKEVKMEPHTAQIPVQTEYIPAQNTTTEAETDTEVDTEVDTEPVTESTADPVDVLKQNILGTWIHTEIQEGQLTPDGGTSPAYLTEVLYTFDETGVYSVSDGTYEEAQADTDPYGEWKEGRYWICIGGGGQSGNYTLNENELTLVTYDSVQYGPSVTSVFSFTLTGDELVIVHNYGTTLYCRAAN